MSGRFKVTDAALLVLVWVVMVLVADPVGDFPQNDDWVYARAVDSIVRTGRFELLDMTSANVGPLAWWGALFVRLFGPGYTSLRYSSLVLGIIGIVALYALALEVCQRRRIAMVLALAILVNPVYFALANTFMTDVPFLVLMLISMLAITAGQRRNRTALIGLGIGVALFTVFLRQFAVVVLVGFAVAHVVRHGPRPKTLLAAIAPLAAALLCHYLFNRWLIESGRKPLIPSQESVLLSALPNGALWKVRYALFVMQSYVGLFLIPLVMLCVPRVRIASRRGSLMAFGFVVAAVVIGGLYLFAGALVPVGGNTLGPDGIGPRLINEAMGEQRSIEPTLAVSFAWKILTGLAIGSSACLVVAIGMAMGRVFTIARDVRGRTASVALVQGSFLVGVALSYLGILLVAATRYPVFDRYVLPLVAVVGLLAALLMNSDRIVERPATNGQWAAALASLAAVAVFTVVATHDHLRWADARWQVLDALVKSGVPPTKIDGGYEFNGTYLYDARYKVRKGMSSWWVEDDEYLIAAGPVPNYAVVDRIVVDRWWKTAGSDVFVLRRLPIPVSR